MAKHLESSFRSPVPVGLAPQNESWELHTSRPGNTPECKSSGYINHLHPFLMKRLNSVYCMILTILLDSDRCVSHCKVYVTAFAVTFKWTEVIWETLHHYPRSNKWINQLTQHSFPGRIFPKVLFRVNNGPQTNRSFFMEKGNKRLPCPSWGWSDGKCIHRGI